MNIIDFSRLFQRQSGVSFPVLVILKHDSGENEHPQVKEWYFTSNNVDIFWNNNLYIAVPMSYKLPSSSDGVPQGGTLEIDIDQHKLLNNDTYYELLKWFDEIDHRATIDVVALINEQGDIDQISQLTQGHGSVTWDGEKISWSLAADDRFNMQVNPWVFDDDALTGYKEDEIEPEEEE